MFAQVTAKNVWGVLGTLYISFTARTRPEYTVWVAIAPESWRAR